ncbi:hypothetical protein IMZ48_10585 [Candidatus Bathyarchaeota archaeon]|nr:hypothetical protein [Candidatus Bathyarchaeota archaeon]
MLVKCRGYVSAYRKRKVAKNPHWDIQQARRWKYGLTLSKQIAMFTEQHGRCPLCGGLLDWDNMAVDHNHKTNNIRGLAHKHCNASLGHIEKYADRIFEILDYLGVELCR